MESGRVELIRYRSKYISCMPSETGRDSIKPIFLLNNLFFPLIIFFSGPAIIVVNSTRRFAMIELEATVKHVVNRNVRYTYNHNSLAR